MSDSLQGISRLAALRFETDGFHLPEKRIMGRQSAGHSFLRAMVGAASGGPMAGVGHSAKTGAVFAEDVRRIDPRVAAKWINLSDHAGLSAAGCMHLPDPSLARHARLRHVFGNDAYSLTGITHTISSDGAMGLLSDLAVAPVMPWDGLICTSQAVTASVETLLDVQEDYLRWRFGEEARVSRPHLATIPLGVHCDDFIDFGIDEAQARRELGLASDEIAFFFLGRLSFHAKAHPYPMYLGLEEVARATGRKIVLVQCGWFANDMIENAFKDGARDFAPSLRHLWLDGTDARQRALGWAASDIFISLSDNIQETFGLTIIEAMAAGKPVIATQWDGYRQTVRHGETGFLIPTFMPQIEAGEEYARAFAARAITYDVYIGLASQHVSVDLRALRDAALALVGDESLRRRLGARARQVARESFDWSVVMRDYCAFWDELGSRRRAASSAGQGDRRAIAEQLDPYRYFAAYPSHGIDARTLVSLHPAAPDWREVSRHALFSLSRRNAAEDALMHTILVALSASSLSVEMLSLAAGLPQSRVIHAVSLLAKWGIVDLSAGGGSRGHDG